MQTTFSTNELSLCIYILFISIVIRGQANTFLIQQETIMTKEKTRQPAQPDKKQKNVDGQPPAQSERRDRQNHLGSHNQTTSRQQSQRSSGNT